MLEIKFEIAVYETKSIWLILKYLQVHEVSCLITHRMNYARVAQDIYHVSCRDTWWPYLDFIPRQTRWQCYCIVPAGLTGLHPFALFPCRSRRCIQLSANDDRGLLRNDRLQSKQSRSGLLHAEKTYGRIYSFNVYGHKKKMKRKSEMMNLLFLAIWDVSSCISKSFDKMSVIQKLEWIVLFSRHVYIPKENLIKLE